MIERANYYEAFQKDFNEIAAHNTAQTYLRIIGQLNESSTLSYLQSHPLLTNTPDPLMPNYYKWHDLKMAPNITELDGLSSCFNTNPKLIPFSKEFEAESRHQKAKHILIMVELVGLNIQITHHNADPQETFGKTIQNISQINSNNTDLDTLSQAQNRLNSYARQTTDKELICTIGKYQTMLETLLKANEDVEPSDSNRNTVAMG